MSIMAHDVADLLYGGSRMRCASAELPPPLASGDFRYFSYGRYALREALKLAGVQQGDVVLLPEYICRENLAAIHALGAHTAFFPVNEALELAVPVDSLPAARAVMAVNYFGFPQDLSPFEEYCRKTGAVLVEDNAHGFLSRDAQGRYLGTRGDLGIFSFRKSIPVLNGSGLVLNHPERTLPQAPQLSYVSYTESRTYRAKRHLRKLAQLHLTGLLYAVIGLERAMRRFRTGEDYVKSDTDAEQVLPGRPEPDANLPAMLQSLDVGYEISRRRQLYSAIDALVTRHGGTPVFRELPAHVVPYGYPFRASADAIGEIRRALRRQYLDCYLWPELPAEIEPRAPEHYKSVWLVNFIW